MAFNPLSFPQNQDQETDSDSNSNTKMNSISTESENTCDYQRESHSLVSHNQVSNAAVYQDYQPLPPKNPYIHQQLHLDDHSMAVRQWFRYVVEKPQYSEIFIINGYNSLHQIRSITDESHIEMLGIDKIGHRKVIMANIKRLNSLEKMHHLAHGSNYTLHLHGRRIFVVQYWIRIFLGANNYFPIELIYIFGSYMQNYDCFDGYASDICVSINPMNESMASFLKFFVENPGEWNSAFGRFVAVSGYKYEWNLRLRQGNDLYVGVINSMACIRKRVPQIWWMSDNDFCPRMGYTCHIHDGKWNILAEENNAICWMDDIISVNLDLVNFILSFKVNGKLLLTGSNFEFVEENCGYRLGVAFGKRYDQSCVEIVSFEIFD